MRRIAGSYRIVSIFAPIAVMVCFSMTAVQAVVFDSLAGAEAEGSLIRSAFCYFPEHGEDLALFAKSDDTGFSQPQTDFQRFFSSPGGTNGSVHAFYPSQFRTSSKSGQESFKNIILFKLRI